MSSIFLLGFLIGMRHALEADHLAAVASLATHARSLGRAVRLGAAWGLGHTLTLFLCGAMVLLLDVAVPVRVAQGLELAVGIMLVVLGADVLRRLAAERLHFHAHRHADGKAHFHAHAHAPDEPHDPDRHRHEHPKVLTIRALLVGMVHGMAGSAALLLLTLETMRSVPLGLVYMLLFGAGSMVGMALLSVVIALPLRYSARTLTGLHNGLQALIGLGTVALGLGLIYEIGCTVSTVHHTCFGFLIS